jgi:hypothetical protein
LASAVLLRRVGALVSGQALHLAQDGGGVDAAAEADDREVGRQIGGGAGAILVDAEETDRVALHDNSRLHEN